MNGSTGVDPTRRDAPHDLAPFGPNPIGFDMPPPGSTSPSAPRTRSLSQRVSRGHVFGVVLGVVGFLLTWILIGDEPPTVEVYAASDAVAAGGTMEVASLLVVEVEDGSPLADHGLLVPVGGDVIYAVSTISPGDPILRSSVSVERPDDGLVDVAVSSELPVTDVEIGDRVGVVSVVDQSSAAAAGWLATAALVTDVASGDDVGGLVSVGAESEVTVAVTPSQALAITAAQQAGDVAIVATGADAPEIDPDERIAVTVDGVGRAITSDVGRTVEAPVANPPALRDGIEGDGTDG